MCIPIIIYIYINEYEFNMNSTINRNEDFIFDI